VSTTWRSVWISGVLYGTLKRFARLLRAHRQWNCNYAKHPITTAHVEAGNVAIGMIRKHARGLLNTEYFKLKIRQTATPAPPFGLYNLTG